ncbi:MKI67 FHA domain-interacting nucleolar phosphoprotein-like [Amphibalanus amphitrite]|uniref:MKI67 FHA domain-interacting nucleolar phosphoprotein-like n=1 Tax=Amphibalanus amphitrite TaxID=1232801 RepID=UPI001C90FA9F|nr:MKI67 FHA domain-interacting nucleolar phosphoprotein-like [Amphibalanus amphitrite]
MAKTAEKVSVERKTSQSPSTKKTKKKRVKNFGKTGVVYLKHIPHGFYEDEMKGFFSQFGTVLRVCVARSPKTGNSKGFGYVQFLEEEVAKIAAETMNNYLMFEKILKCTVLPPEQVTAATFASATRRPGRNCPGQKRTERALELLSARKGPTQKKNAQKRREAAHRRTMVRLAQLGIKYDLNGGLVQEIEPVPAPTAGGDTTADTTADSAQLPVMEVDESDDEVTFKTPPNVIKRRLSRPAASTPQSATPARSKPSTPVATKQTPKATTTPKSAAKKVAKSPKSAAGTPKTPKSMAKKTPPKSVKQLSAKKKTPSKKTPPKSGRKR